jgi:hypothetical protein
MVLDDFVYCELYCLMLNSTFMFNCNSTLLYGHNFQNVFGTVLFSIYTIKPWVFIIPILFLIFGLWIYYVERYKIKSGISISIWRRNIYLERKVLSITWKLKFQPIQLFKELFKLQISIFKQSIELFLNNFKYIGKYSKNCVNLCGNKTLNNECIYCEYHKTQYPTKKLPADRQIIITILCMQKTPGTVWSIISHDVVKHFCQNYLSK